MTARFRRHYRVTLMALCCLLLSQWTLLSHACPLTHRAADTIAQVAHAATDCHDAEAAPAGHDEPSALCLKHCEDENSVSNGFSLVIPPAATPPLVIHLPVVPLPLPLHWQQAPRRSNAAAPPLPLLYCVSLT